VNHADASSQYYNRLADAMRKHAGEPEPTCSLCHKRDHVTADHPAPLSTGICARCYAGECQDGGPCDKGEWACDCACIARTYFG